MQLSSKIFLFMSQRSIKRVAILGSGVMGSRIACHVAGIGVQVLLLDIVGKDATESTDAKQRNKVVNDALSAAIKSNPSPVFTADVAKKITTGNFDDDMHRIKDCDWIIEVVVERLDIKKLIYSKVEMYRKPGTLITSNTSGIPINMLCADQTDDFKKHFCGTHFFNPPRYLRLLEIIPTKYTDPDIVSFLMNYGDLYLGKATVLCKDTPAFIANRVGVFSIMHIIKTMETLGLAVDEVDALTGPIIGRAKSATFRTADVVGIDTLVKVAQGVHDFCPNDEAKNTFIIPDWLQTMLTNNWLGDKTAQGFYKKTKGAIGEKEIHTLDIKTMAYTLKPKAKLAGLEAAKQTDNLYARIKMLCAGKDITGDFYRKFHYGLFSYVSYRVPEISDSCFSIDDAMMAGFGWEIGAFETWDVLGVAKTTEAIKAAGLTVALWVDEMIAAGHNSFYKVENGVKLSYTPVTKQYEPTVIVSNASDNPFIVMSNFVGKEVYKDNTNSIYHLGDDVLGLRWDTKMNSLTGEVLGGINKAIELAENNYKGLVIANEGAQFSAGANLAMVFMFSIEQEYDDLEMAIRMFQKTVMRVRYSSIPVVVAPHGLALGGGCELCLHADKVVAAAETYTGLVEVGVGVIPGGGGTKEFVLRAADEMHEEEPETITLKKRFLSIATAKVATSAHDAYDLGIYRKGQDIISMNVNRRISLAKQEVIDMFNAGYTMPVERTDIKVLGKAALGSMYAGVHGMVQANYATAHDAVIARKLAYVMCGGDLSEPQFVSEQYLLDLEREAFLSLCAERKTLERIQSILTKGKPLRN
jgi:3-hydroxyacyl-CoA dehydrogenase